MLRDSRLYELLLKFDVDLAAKVRAAGCACGGRLDAAHYPRKPRGGPSTLGDEHGRRLSFCCAVDGCRSRATPPSVRFLGPKVYGGAVVVLAAAMQHGPSKKRVAQIEVLLVSEGLARVPVATIGEFKNAYSLDFLALPDDHSEADLHGALLRNLGRFITELGRDFCFVGSAYPVQVGNQDFAIDLVFFHRTRS